MVYGNKQYFRVTGFLRGHIKNMSFLPKRKLMQKKAYFVFMIFTSGLAIRKASSRQIRVSGIR